MDMPEDVRERLEQLNRLLGTQRILSAKLEAVAEVVHRVVPGCDAVSVTLIVEERAITGASSSQLAVEADMVQYQHDEGPCLSAAGERKTVRIDALQHDERFEHFAPGAIGLGVESVLSVPLMAGTAVVGSINLYSRRAGAFPEDTPDRIATIARYAADLITSSPLYDATVEMVERLLEVVDDAAQVEIAVGMLIVRRDMGPAEAWDHLRALASDAGSSIAACARQLIEDQERHPEA